MINYKYKIENSNGDYIFINDFITDPNRFFALQEYPGFEVDVKNNEIAKEGQHGIWDFYSFYGKRVINFQGVMIGLTEADIETLKTQLLKIVSLPSIPENSNDGYVTISWTDANAKAWQVEAKLQGYPRFNRDLRQLSRLYFNIVLKAKNPQIESQTLTTTSGIRGWKSTNHLLASLLPMVFGTLYKNQVTVNNIGSVEAHTIIKIYGETGGITNPSIYNITTGKTFKLNLSLADATKYVTINSKTGEILDQDGNDMSAFIDGSSEYILLIAGNNSIVYLSDENPFATLTDPSAVIDISYRETII